MRVRQLAEQHRYELAPTAEASGVPLALMLLHEAFELGPRKQLQKLTENTAYSIQGGASWLFARFSQTATTYQRRRPSQNSQFGQLWRCRLSRREAPALCTC
jgi:hypothetical protein